MKRKVCESLFAVTLALIVAVTNIPVTAFGDRDKSVCETGTDD